jgi:pentatricopeptide repeat protein
MSVRDIISWNSVIQGLGQNGLGKQALMVAERALEQKICNGNTFIAIPGIVQPRWVDCGGGLSYFDAMTEKHGVERKLDRYICAMDLLGRAGRGWKRCISCYGACRSHQTRLRGLPFCILAWSIRTAPWGAWLRCAGAENSSAWWWRELRETTDAGLWQCWFETVRPREKCKSCSRLQLGHLSF